MAQMSVNPCDPPVARCASPNYPLFTPGIATRQVPLCGAGPTCECETPGTARMRLTAAGTLDRSRWIEGWIIAQLVTRGEVSCDEHPLRQRAGGWWADAFRSGGFRSGSKLWSLQWSHVTNDALILAKQYATQALNYLIGWGIAASIKIETSYVSQKVMRLHITVSGPGLARTVTIDGTAMPDAGWLWAEYEGA
jgi:phage gp46-like protein